MSEGTRGRGLSSIGLLREAPGGRKGLARGSALREDGASQPYPKGRERYMAHSRRNSHDEKDNGVVQ